MNQKLQYFFLVFLSFGIIMISIQKCGTVEKIIVKEQADTNAIRDYISDEFQAEKLVLLDSIDKLNARSKVAKNNYKESYSKYKPTTQLVLKIDSTGDIIYQGKKYTAVTEIDSSCAITLNYANEYISKQDTLLSIKDRVIDKCGDELVNMRAKSDYNKRNAETLLMANIEVQNENDSLKKKFKGSLIVNGILAGILAVFVIAR